MQIQSHRNNFMGLLAPYLAPLVAAMHMDQPGQVADGQHARPKRSRGHGGNHNPKGNVKAQRRTMKQQMTKTGTRNRRRICS